MDAHKNEENENVHKSIQNLKTTCFATFALSR